MTRPLTERTLFHPETPDDRGPVEYSAQFEDMDTPPTEVPLADEQMEVIATAVVDDRIVAWTRKLERAAQTMDDLEAKVHLVDREIQECVSTLQALKVIQALVRDVPPPL